MPRYRLSIPCLAALSLVPLAHADADGWISQVHLGVLDHGVFGREHDADINGEIVFTSPVSDGAVAGVTPSLRWLLQPRPNVGFDVNLASYTDQVYAGATWTAPLTRQVFSTQDSTFFNFGFGPALNNGHVGPSASSDRSALGANVLFHLQGEIGYQVTPRWNMSVYFEHSSNAGLARYNESLNGAGLRVGLGF
jgi:hypothetical protein